MRAHTHTHMQYSRWPYASKDTAAVRELPQRSVLNGRRASLNGAHAFDTHSRVLATTDSTCAPRPSSPANRRSSPRAHRSPSSTYTDIDALLCFKSSCSKLCERCFDVLRCSALMCAHMSAIRRCGGGGCASPRMRYDARLACHSPLSEAEARAATSLL